MELYLYRTVDGDNVMFKTLTGGIKIDVKLKSSVDIVRPIIRLTQKNGIDFNDFNYMEIPFLERKYFITDINSINRNIFELHCQCDVIETYWMQILASRARFKRKLKNGDFIQTDIDYSVIKTATKYVSETQAFTNDSTIILTTLGA